MQWEHQNNPISKHGQITPEGYLASHGIRQALKKFLYEELISLFLPHSLYTDMYIYIYIIIFTTYMWMCIAYRYCKPTSCQTLLKEFAWPMGGRQHLFNQLHNVQPITRSLTGYTFIIRSRSSHIGMLHMVNYQVEASNIRSHDMMWSPTSCIRALP